MLKTTERIEDLQLDGLKIIQDSNGYCFTSDSVILANFVKAKQDDKILEIGAGSAVISILVSYKTKCNNITALEIQPRLADMATRSVKLNNLEDKIRVLNEDVKKFVNNETKNSYDVIFSNPPYKKVDSVIEIQNEEKQICRYEKTLTLEELVNCASLLLKDKGKFFIVYEAERVVDLLTTLRLKKLEPKTMFFTQPNENKNAKLIVVEAIKNAKSSAKVLPTLFTNDLEGNYIYSIEKFYKGK